MDIGGLPETLRAHYSAFLRSPRVLMTGHSHQAWPDAARDGLIRAFDDAAEHVDDKWERAFEAAEAVRNAVAERISAKAEDIALGASCHELVSRFLSALDWTKRRHVVTTTGEFHSLRRQLERLREAGVEVTFVNAEPVATLAARIADAIRTDTAAALVSTVLFETSAIVPDLREIADASHRQGAHVLFDAYHAFNVVPFRVAELGPDPVFVTAGGYKYAQWGEGCCFLRVPPDCDLRPVYTGWFADFAHLDSPPAAGSVAYGDVGAERFAGSTYDPASHYRARSVIEFFKEHGLGVDVLRALSLRQTSRLLAALAAFEIRTPREDHARGGFVALRIAHASDIVKRLRAENIFVDARGDTLRLGPAPYTTDDEIDRAAAVLSAS